MRFQHDRSFLCLVLVFTVVVVFSPGEVHAAGEDVGSASGVFLKLDPSAQSAALGSAYLGRTGVLSSHFNPAGLNGVRASEGLATQNNLVAGVSYRYLSLAYPTETFDGGAGLSVTQLDYGSQDQTQIQNSDPLTDFGQFGASDLALAASYGFAPIESINLGGSLKYAQTQIAGYSDGTVTGDLGVQVQTPVPSLRLGVSGRNLFGSITLNEESDPLPRIYEAGANMNLALIPGSHEFLLGLGAGTSNDAEPYGFTGLEYRLYNLASLRLGYNGRQDAGDGFTGGIGFNFGNLSVDYAYVSFGDLGRYQRFTVGYKFGTTPTTDEQEEQKQPRESTQPETNRETEPEEPRYDWYERFQKAWTKYQEGKPQKAYEALRRINEDFPNKTEVLLGLGIIEFQRGDFESAKTRMEAVLILDPDNRHARKHLKVINRKLK